MYKPYLSQSTIDQSNKLATKARAMLDDISEKAELRELLETLCDTFPPGHKATFGDLTIEPFGVDTLALKLRKGADIYTLRWKCRPYRPEPTDIRGILAKEKEEAAGFRRPSYAALSPTQRQTLDVKISRLAYILQKWEWFFPFIEILLQAKELMPNKLFAGPPENGTFMARTKGLVENGFDVRYFYTGADYLNGYWDFSLYPERTTMGDTIWMWLVGIVVVFLILRGCVG